MYQSLKRKGLAPQFECAGIYAILLEGKIVYIGKSRNILMRMAQHYAQLAQGKEHKYRILAEATRSGHKMCFTVLYRAKQTDYDAITEEIGNMEGLVYPPPQTTSESIDTERRKLAAVSD